MFEIVESFHMKSNLAQTTVVLELVLIEWFLKLRYLCRKPHVRWHVKFLPAFCSLLAQILTVEDLEQMVTTRTRVFFLCVGNWK